MALYALLVSTIKCLKSHALGVKIIRVLATVFNVVNTRFFQLNAKNSRSWHKKDGITALTRREIRVRGTRADLSEPAVGIN